MASPFIYGILIKLNYEKSSKPFMIIIYYVTFISGCKKYFHNLRKQHRCGDKILPL